jgi:transglutaminase superfamily protein
MIMPMLNPFPLPTPRELAVKMMIGAACTLLLAVRAALLIAPGRVVAWAAAPRDGPPAASPWTDAHGARLAALIARAGHYLIASCLEQAIALVLILRVVLREDVRLLLGATHDEGGLRAHAWVDASGTALLGERAARRFLPLLPPT